MAITLKDIFDEICEGVNFDQALVTRLVYYKLGFINKNASHTSFFGNVLLGVDTVKHTPADRTEFFEDVIGVDEEECRLGVLRSPVVEKEFKRLADPYNLLSIYVAHRIFKSNLPQKQKDIGMAAVTYMLQVKLFTSILNHWYHKPASIEEARATYASLTMKNSIKQVASWDEWFDARVNDLLSPESIHINAFHNFTPDTGTRGGTLYAVTEPQDRLRKAVIVIYEAHKLVRAKGSKIKTSSSTFSIDGEILIKSNTDANKQYNDYLQAVLMDKNSFIRSEVLTVVTDAVGSVSETLLVQLLAWFSTQHGSRSKTPTKQLVEGLITHAISFIQENRLELKRVDDFALLVIRLKDLYMAPRLKDEGLLKCREMARKMTVDSKVSKSAPQIESLKTALQLYCVVRALTKSYYK